MTKFAAAAVIAAMLSVTMFSSARSEAAAARSYSAAQRAAIRGMPITVRPNRPGHVYGNTVRALNRFGF